MRMVLYYYMPCILYIVRSQEHWILWLGIALQYTAILFSLKNCILLYAPCMSKARILKLLESPRIDSNFQFRQAMNPGGPVRQPYSYSIPSPHKLFKNSSTESVLGTLDQEPIYIQYSMSTIWFEHFTII